MDRTIHVELQPNSQQCDALHTTLRQFTDAYNFVCAYGWNANEKNGVRLHHATYYETKARCPGLVSDLLIQARVKATETLKSAFTWQAKKEAAYPKRVAKAEKMGWKIPVFTPVKCPQSEQCAIRYNVHTYTLDWAQQTVRLSTSAGKMTIGFRIPHFSEKYVGHPIATADLCFRQGRWWLHVVVDVPEPALQKNETIVGVDLGLNRPAVTSQRHFLGDKHWKERDRRFFRLKRNLQSNGSKSAKRHLKKMGQQQARFHRDCDHVLSKRIVHSVPAGATIVFENLTNIRETSTIGRGKGGRNVWTRRKLHSWTFAQLFAFVDYKAQELGVHVERVDPRHTSQTCSRCGYQARTNRRSLSLFHCRSCGYELNADLNAAYTIRDKFCLASRGTSVGSGLSSTSLSSQASV
jgi:putative transposase